MSHNIQDFNSLVCFRVYHEEWSVRVQYFLKIKYNTLHAAQKDWRNVLNRKLAVPQVVVILFGSDNDLRRKSRMHALKWFSTATRFIFQAVFMFLWRRVNWNGITNPCKEHWNNSVHLWEDCERLISQSNFLIIVEVFQIWRPSTTQVSLSRWCSHHLKRGTYPGRQKEYILSEKLQYLRRLHWELKHQISE